MVAHETAGKGLPSGDGVPPACLASCPAALSPPQLQHGQAGAVPVAMLPDYPQQYMAQVPASEVGSTLPYCRQSSGYAVPVNSPHQQSRLFNVYSNANSLMSSSFNAGAGAQNLTSMLAGANISTPPAAQSFQQAPDPAFAHGQAAHSSHGWQQPGSNTWFSTAAGPAPQQQAHKVQRSASDRISPRAAPDTANAVPMQRAQSASRQQAASASTTSRTSSSGQTGRSTHHLGKNPASGYAGVPLTPAQTLVRYGGVSSLTEFEQGEVLAFPHVYYVGSGANKHHARPNHRAISLLRSRMPHSCNLRTFVCARLRQVLHCVVSCARVCS